ncbi:MAG TPA: radical SAM protein, partial [Armatimonadota bacterium]|nr:radical SAM protein [Armatimonadota bacterium]
MTPRDLSERLECFAEPHRERLRGLLGAPAWQSAIAEGLLDDAAAGGVAPPETENVFALPVEQLVAANGAATRARIAAGERDPERLLDVLGTWPAEWPAELPVRLSFLGLNLGFACNMQPRCVYCNQRPVPSRLRPDRLPELIADARGQVGKGPYVYLTGGEPLLAGPALWGPEGLIRRAAAVGASCNLNTNALALTPEVALGLVRSGLGRAHISVDTHVPEVADGVYGAPGRWQQAMTGLWNL